MPVLLRATPPPTLAPRSHAQQAPVGKVQSVIHEEACYTLKIYLRFLIYTDRPAGDMRKNGYHECGITVGGA